MKPIIIVESGTINTVEILRLLKEGKLEIDFSEEFLSPNDVLIFFKKKL